MSASIGIFVLHRFHTSDTISRTKTVSGWNDSLVWLERRLDPRLKSSPSKRCWSWGKYSDKVNAAKSISHFLIVAALVEIKEGWAEADISHQWLLVSPADPGPSGQTVARAQPPPISIGTNCHPPLQCLAGYYHIKDGHLLDTKKQIGC